MLPFLRTFIPGRADHCSILQEAIIEEVSVYQTKNRRRSVKKIVDFIWTPKQEKSFQAIKKYITETVITGGDDQLQYHLATDASATGLGDLLFQVAGITPGTPMNKKLIDEAKIVMCMSYQLLSAGRRYHTTEREALAVLRSLEEVR